MAFGRALLLIVSLSSLLLLANAFPLPRDRIARARVWNLCRGTTNPRLCFQTISAELRDAFNPFKALETEILATQRQVKKTAGVIEALLADPRSSKLLRDSLGTCRQQYENILDSINESMKEVARRDPFEARFKFSAVLSFHGTCDDEFKGLSPIAGDSSIVYQLGANCLDIMKGLEEKIDRRNRRKRVVNPVPVVSQPDPCFGVIGPCDLD